MRKVWSQTVCLNSIVTGVRKYQIGKMYYFSNNGFRKRKSWLSIYCPGGKEQLKCVKSTLLNHNKPQHDTDAVYISWVYPYMDNQLIDETLWNGFIIKCSPNYFIEIFSVKYDAVIEVKRLLLFLRKKGILAHIWENRPPFGAKPSATPGYLATPHTQWSNLICKLVSFRITQILFKLELDSN